MSTLRRLPTPLTHPLTIDEYAALGEDEHGRTELQEGNLVMSPSPLTDHMGAIAQLAYQLIPQLSAELSVVPAVRIW